MQLLVPMHGRRLDREDDQRRMTEGTTSAGLTERTTSAGLTERERRRLERAESERRWLE
jgi:hypothetical protein